jgi:hypothetical protein
MTFGFVRKMPFGLVLGCLVLASCTSTPRVVVRSEPPGAEVWVKDRFTGTKSVLGNTPLEVSSSLVDWIIGPNSANTDFWEILVSKEGFQTAQYYLPRQLASSIVGFNVKLVPGVDDERAKAIVERLFSAQRFAVKGDFEKAHREVDGVLLVWPRFARALSMRGSIFLIQRRYHDALDSFEGALQADAKLDEARRMVGELRRFLGRSGGSASEELAGRSLVPAAPAASPRAVASEVKPASAPTPQALAPSLEKVDLFGLPAGEIDKQLKGNGGGKAPMLPSNFGVSK